jgi:hypothetical protein
MDMVFVANRLAKNNRGDHETTAVVRRVPPLNINMPPKRASPACRSGLGSLDTMQMIKDGKIAFVTSQVPFNQGYLPVQFLAAYIKYGVLPGGPRAVVDNGGFFVDKTNVDKIVTLVNSGIY